MNYSSPAPDSLDLGAFMRSLAGGLGLTPPPPSKASAATDAAFHRALCLALAGMSVGKDASTYDRIAAADYLEHGYRPEEPPACACQTTEQATHPRGDEAFCTMMSDSEVRQ